MVGYNFESIKSADFCAITLDETLIWSLEQYKSIYTVCSKRAWPTKRNQTQFSWAWTKLHTYLVRCWIIVNTSSRSLLMHLILLSKMPLTCVVCPKFHWDRIKCHDWLAQANSTISESAKNVLKFNINQHLHRGLQFRVDKTENMHNQGSSLKSLEFCLNCA